MEVSPCAQWHYEPSFSDLPKMDFDLVVLDRGIDEEECAFLTRFSRAYCLFVTENVDLSTDSPTRFLFLGKMGRKISREELGTLLRDDLPDYFPESYGEKYEPFDLSIAQGFSGRVAWQGYEGVNLEGDYGDSFNQVAFWRINIPTLKNRAIEFYLEYKKDETVEISLEVTVLKFEYGTNPKSQQVWTFTERQLDNPVYIKTEGFGHVFASLKAKGRGKLTIVALHDRHSRRGKGHFLPGGRRVVTAQREELFYYFDPGNWKPPLNVYFSGYKTQEGFEGYNMMRRLGHPFLLIAEARLEGGAYYIGSREYEKALEDVIRAHMKILHFDHSQVILSGLSMGTFGALYYGCKLRPNTILLGKPLASIGTVAENTMIKCSEGSNAWVDVLHKICGSIGPEAVEALNHKFWDLFDRTDWSETRFAVSYMIEDDMDGDAYEKLLSHVQDPGVRIYGKGLHGRHNDNTRGIVQWFVNQHREIIQRDFHGEEERLGG